MVARNVIVDGFGPSFVVSLPTEQMSLSLSSSMPSPSMASSCSVLIDRIAETTGLPSDAFVLRRNGLPLGALSSLLEQEDQADLHVHVHLTGLFGGKGGFGALLRGNQAQVGVKKTTNFDAMRDLQGRRLGTVNNEVRIAHFEKDRAEKKAKELEEHAQKKREQEHKRMIEEELERKRKAKEARHTDKEGREMAKKMMETVKLAINGTGTAKKRKANGNGGDDDGDDIDGSGSSASSDSDRDDTGKSKTEQKSSASTSTSTSNSSATEEKQHVQKKQRVKMRGDPFGSSSEDEDDEDEDSK